MATRRSRIKAVANLPARRGRPLAVSDAKKEIVESEDGDISLSPSVVDKDKTSVEVSQLSKNEDGDSSLQQGSASDSRIPTDRKTVIVALEKDRKTVIVNRDDCISSTLPITKLESEPSLGCSSSGNSTLLPEHEKDIEVPPDDHTQNDIKKFSSSTPSFSDGKNTDSSSSTPNAKPQDVKASDVSKDTTDSNAILNKHTPIRTRRAKPTVNLIAAARKRPSNDVSASLPCSPPPSKIIKSTDVSQKNSESENSNVTTSCSKTFEKSHQPESPLKVDQVAITNDQRTSSLDSEAILSPSNNKASSNTSEHFKIPSSPVLKIKDSAPVTSNDLGEKGDAATPGSSQKDLSKRKPSANAQKVAAARKSLKNRIGVDGVPQRASLTMFDLIFYNPVTNPLKSADSSSKKSRRRLTSVSSVSSINEERLTEESIDDIDSDMTTENVEVETAMPVPQVKVGPDGNLILDEQSLVIETTGTKKSREDLEKSEAVVDTGSGYGHYKKIIRSKDWSDHETKKFYRALNVVGTDFSLMKPYFRKRSRKELKLKFKKEEKLNPKLINKALAEPLDFDISELEKECEMEDEEEKRLEEMEKEKSIEKLNEKAGDDIEKHKTGIKKKKKKRGSMLLHEMELESDSNVKIATKVISKKSKKRSDVEAEADYRMLAGGVSPSNGILSKVIQKSGDNSSTKGLQKEANDGTAAAFSILVDLPENIKKSPANKTRKRKVPCNEEGQDQEPRVLAADCIKKESSVNSTKRKQTKSQSESVSENIPVCTNAGTSKDGTCNDSAANAAPSVSRICQAKVQSKTPSILKTQILYGPQGSSFLPTSPSASIPGSRVIATPKVIVTHGTEIKRALMLPGISPLSGPKVITSNSKAHQGIELKSPPTLSGSQAPVSSLSQGQIVQTSPVVTAPTLATPLVSSTSSRTIKIVRKQLPSSPSLIVPESKVLTLGGVSCVSSNKSTPSPCNSKSVQGHGSDVPVTSASISPASGVKIVSTPLSKIRTVQVTPQSVPNLAGFGASTPVSRLLPSTPTLPRMEPGSIIVLKTPLPHDPERHVLQVYMVTSTPQNSSASIAPLTPNLSNIDMLSGPSVQPASAKSESFSDESDCEKVLTKL